MHVFDWIANHPVIAMVVQAAAASIAIWVYGSGTIPRGKRLSEREIETIRAFRGEGYSNHLIAESLGVHVETIRRVVASGATYTPPSIEYSPTPAEIRKACRDIQAEWTADVEEKRRVVKNHSVNFEAPYQQHREAA